MPLLFLDADHDVSLCLVESNIVLDLLHLRQRIGVVPRRVLDLSLVRRYGVVRRVTLVWTVRRCGCWGEV